MDLNCRGRNLLVQTIGSVRERLEPLSGQLEPEVLEQLLWQADELAADLQELEAAFLEPGMELGRDMSPELFDLAARYCHLHSAAASLLVWLHSREGQSGFFADGRWLVLALHRVLSRLRPREVAPPRAFVDGVAEEMIRRHEEKLLFGIVPMPLAGSAEREEANPDPLELALAG
jgi:hypothetical protein